MRLVFSLAAFALAISLLTSCGGAGSPVPESTKAQAQAFAGNGVWWNPAESGSGIFVEAQGNTAVVAFYVYDDGGRPVWYSATGPLVAGTGGTFQFSADLLRFSGGQSAASAAPKTPVSTVIGRATVTFDGEQARIQVPGRSFSAEKFRRAGRHVPATANEPRTGIYWNPAEGGRGYTVEVADHALLLAVFHYAADGQPTWHLVSGPGAADGVSRPLEMVAYAGGQTLGGSYKPPSSAVSQGYLGVAFYGGCMGAIAFPQMAPVPISRFVFGTAPECEVPVAGGLSQVQALFEESTLASRGGSYQILQAISTTLPRRLLFAITTWTEVPSSPAGFPVGVLGTVSRANGISTTPQAGTQDPDAGTAYADKGQIQFVLDATPPRYTYNGDGIDIEHRSVDGQFAVQRRVVSIEKVPLAGKFTDAPKEFLGFFSLFAARPEVSFLPGAAYYRYVAVRTADVLALDDADGSTKTHPRSVTPFFSGSIEQFATAKPDLLDLSAGTIKTVKGLRCWIGNKAAPYKNSFGTTTSSGIDPTFRAVCQHNGSVYGGSFQPEGALIGALMPQANDLLSTPAPVYPVLNKWAVDSLSAMAP